jgi:hypothetical protein
VAFTHPPGGMGHVEGRGLKDPYATNDVGYANNYANKVLPEIQAMEASTAIFEKGYGKWPLDYPGIPGTAAPPIPSPAAPAAGATGVARTATITLTFNEPMDASSINATTITLRQQGQGADVAATVTYNPTTRTATLDPGPTLAATFLHTVTVKGGATGVKDADGIPLAANFTYSFTTGA